MASQRTPLGGGQKMGIPPLVKEIHASRTLSEEDYSRILECYGNITLTVDSRITPGSFQAVIVNMGEGVITFATPNSLLSKDSAVTIDTQYAAATIYHNGNGVWVLLGDIA